MIDFEEAKKYVKDYKVVPISQQILSDFTTPIQALKKLLKVSHHCYMLESVENQENRGRYTFLGYDPTMELTCSDGVVTIVENNQKKQYNEIPAKCIKRVLENYKSPKIEGLPTFTGGLVGYFSYDYVKYSEPNLEIKATNEEGFKDVDLMLFDKVIAFDNLTQTIHIIVNARTTDFEKEYQRCKAEINEMIDLIRNGKEKEILPGKLTSPFQPLFTEDAYCEMVNKAKKYIYDGDIFQVVLSNRLEADYEGSLLNAYRLLRSTNPSPYMFYFCSDDLEVAGASPETLVKLENNLLSTYPLAGTRPRGKSLEEDEALIEDLLKDEKECAEHNMLVDLGRNDLGKISRFGSVVVSDYMKVQKYSHVMHISSKVNGELREDKDCMDAVDAILPAGTLSGAPKHRAMQIIDELENNKRGIYGGAIGYIDFTGNLDTCIAIRIAFRKNGKVYIRTGAGIVADSVPQKEYQECINKAKAVVQAVNNGQTQAI